ncbi:MAG TPA: SpoIID/LytB domain-containing protein [Actinomycetota bacterium]|nr:SpoIID/LytB domain-containing protein [Actinomycetota bacterium]
MRRRIPLLVVVLLSLPPAPARAADRFTFYGSGYGHGLGLSQWGAYGLALEGWSHQEILAHFYTGTEVARVADAPARLRIGLVQGERRVRLTAEAAPVELRLDGPRGELVATVPAGETWTVRARDGRYRIFDAAGSGVGGPVGGPDRHLFAVYAPTGARVRIPEAGHAYARGWIEFNLYDCPDACRIRLVLSIASQEYLYGLGEVPSSWPEEALEAQAVAARTYAFAKAAYGQHRPVCNCALYASAADQVYVGWDKEAGEDGERWVRAVDATEGEVVTYQGQVITAFYSSSSGGHTEDNENVWGGTPIPYLRGVCDPGDYTPANPSRVWQVAFTAEEVTRLLRPYTGDIGAVRGFARAERGVSGRIVSILVRGDAGQARISGGELRVGLGLRDDRVWINVDKNVVGAIRAKYDALGCAPGLPTTPRVRLPSGLVQRFTVGAIYRNEAADATAWLRGPIYDKYLALGEATSVLGLPRSGVVRLRTQEGCGQVLCARAGFDGGRIYYKDGIGAFELHGPVLDSYLGLGGAGGSLGFPTSDVRARPDGGSAADFEGGRIVCSSAGRCRTR